MANRAIERPVPKVKRPFRIGSLQRLVLTIAAAQAPNREWLRSAFMISRLVSRNRYRWSAQPEYAIKTHSFPVRPEVPDEVLHAMISFEPRQQQNKIQTVLALATIDHSTPLNLQHWHRTTQAGSDPVKRSMGFIN